MGKKPSKRRAALRLRDLDHSKSAILNSLGSPASRRAYEFAIDEFIAWYCSEPRLAFSRVVVTRYRLYLEARGLAASSINQRLAAVRRLAYEAADCGLLSPELAAGIRRVRGVKQLGRRSGNWLSLEQCSTILDVVTGGDLRAKRDHAMISTLVAAASAAPNWWRSIRNTYRSARGIGRSSIWSGKAATSAPSPCRNGSRTRSMAGHRRRGSLKDACFAPSAGQAGFGAAALARTWCGTW